MKIVLQFNKPKIYTLIIDLQIIIHDKMIKMDIT